MILVCGGRDFTDEALVRKVLGEYEPEESFLAHGDARGADFIAARYCIERRWARVDAYPAEWAIYGKGAGHRRNVMMLAFSKPDLVIAFPGGRGTADMVALAREAGVEVREVKSSALKEPVSGGAQGKKGGQGAVEK